MSTASENRMDEIRMLKEENQALKEAYERVKRSDTLKTEFLVNMSNEIRTPLNSIVGFAELITMDGLSDEDRYKFYNSIATNTACLLSIIGDVLDVSFIENNNVECVKRPISVVTFLNEIADEIPMLRAKYDKEVISFIIEKPDFDIVIETDDMLLKKALVRLLDNSFKFTPDGGKVSLSVAQSETGSIIFSVTDNGVGISEGQKEGVFESFIPNKNFLTRSYGGSGLGLAAAKGFADVLGATISFSSKEGLGSVFHFEIPRDAVL